MKIVCRFGVLLSAGLLLACSSQDYRDPSLPPQKRAELLLKQMNVEEKVAQLYSTAEQTFIVDRGANIDSLKQKMPYGTGILYLNMYGDPQEYAQACSPPHCHNGGRNGLHFRNRFRILCRFPPRIIDLRCF